ncbi:MAG TPA: hypothetical protein VIM48_11415 [Chthoniobacterales bacterium]
MNSNLRDIASNAISFWERCRIIYNAVLGLIVLVYFVLGLRHQHAAVTLDGVLGFFILAVVANVLFCAAYVPDFVAQISAFRAVWLRIRWILFLVGLAVAAIFTRWTAISAFGLIR